MRTTGDRARTARNAYLDIDARDNVLVLVSEGVQSASCR